MCKLDTESLSSHIIYIDYLPLILTFTNIIEHCIEDDSCQTQRIHSEKIIVHRSNSLHIIEASTKENVKASLYAEMSRGPAKNEHYICELIARMDVKASNEHISLYL